MTVPAAPLVLIVEDEPPLAEILRYNLERAGFRTALAGDSEEAALALADEPPELVILDWMLPGSSGLEFCRRLRERPATRTLPILMLTARADEADRVQGLEAGADDYVVKPFSPRELVARVRALLRRARPAVVAETLAYADLEMDLAAHRVRRWGRPMRLGPTEFRLLKVLMERPGRVFTRERLLDLVWGRDIHVEPRTVDVHIRRLRRTIGQQGEPDLIRTVRGVGYALEAPGTAADATSP